MSATIINKVKKYYIIIFSVAFLFLSIFFAYHALVAPRHGGWTEGTKTGANRISNKQMLEYLERLASNHDGFGDAIRVAKEEYEREKKQQKIMVLLSILSLITSGGFFFGYKRKGPQGSTT